MPEFFPTSMGYITEIEGCDSIDIDSVDSSSESALSKADKARYQESNIPVTEDDITDVRNSKTHEDMVHNETYPLIDDFDNVIDDHSDSGEIVTRRNPVKLENNCVNVCFFNSIVQILYSLPLFHNYLAVTLVDNNVVEVFKDLFEAMNFASGIVTTFPYVNQLQLPHYQFGNQYDAPEALTYIIEECYPDYSKSNFGVTIEESFVCEERLGGCEEKFDKPECQRILPLRIEETFEIQTVQNLLDKHVDYHIPEDYRCELGLHGGCKKINTVSKASLVTELKDILIVQLVIFTHDIEGNNPFVKRKIFPAIDIDHNITTFDNFSLQGIFGITVLM